MTPQPQYQAPAGYLCASHRAPKRGLGSSRIHREKQSQEKPNDSRHRQANRAGSGTPAHGADRPAKSGGKNHDQQVVNQEDWIQDRLSRSS